MGLFNVWDLRELSSLDAKQRWWHGGWGWEWSFELSAVSGSRKRRTKIIIIKITFHVKTTRPFHGNLQTTRLLFYTLIHFYYKNYLGTGSRWVFFYCCDTHGPPHCARAHRLLPGPPSQTGTRHCTPQAIGWRPLRALSTSCICLPSAACPRLLQYILPLLPWAFTMASASLPSLSPIPHVLMRINS